jgi:hypothetical protein
MLLRVLILLVSFAFIPTGISENDQEKFITWNASRKLSWDDFKAKHSSNSRHAALSHTGISVDLSERDGLMTVRLEARFDKSQSWKKDDNPTLYLLAHEQLHFDITELYARKMRRQILEHQWLQEKDWVKAFEKMFEQNQAELWNFQGDYDRFTNHSLVEAAQSEWREAISDSLKLYSGYINPEVSVRVR